jgi:predicted component of type VI protein secretion system
MSTHRVLTSMLLLLCTLTACSAGAPRTGSVPAPRTYVTGSLIAAPGLNPALQTVSWDDITVTGQTQLSPALHQLVPSLQ